MLIERLKVRPMMYLAPAVVAALFFALAALTLFSLDTRVAAQADGQSLFDQKCKACHSLGGGRGVGPDLKGITSTRDQDWLVRFITIPDKLIAQGDPIALQIVKEYGLPMPNLGVSEADARAILSYIASQSGGAASPSAKPTTTSTAVPPTSQPAPSGAGAGLFNGTSAFQNGGVACLSCHNVAAAGILAGGTVGKDLSGAYSSMGEAGLSAILKSAPFPAMKAVYGGRPLSESEVAALVTFLKDAGNGSATTSRGGLVFILIGIGGALVIVLIMQLVWRQRLSAVRRPLVKGVTK